MSEQGWTKGTAAQAEVGVDLQVARERGLEFDIGSGLDADVEGHAAQEVVGDHGCVGSLVRLREQAADIRAWIESGADDRDCSTEQALG